MPEYLPYEIVVEILHRLPPKSVVRCTSVCKQWGSLITHPSFISHHLRTTTAAATDHFLLIQLCDEKRFPNHPSCAPVRYSLRRDDHRLPELTTLCLPTIAFEREFSVVGICNGLVCITGSDECHDLIICNPCVRRYVTLPKPRDDYPFFYSACVGFGFDSVMDDYKVVRIAWMLDDESYGLSAPQVELYSLATGFWKDITRVAPVCSLCFVGGNYAPSAFINGIVHWGAKRRVDDDQDDVDDEWYHFILSFDFGDEVFGEIKLPQSLARGSSAAVSVIGGGGKYLSVCHVSSFPCTCNIWVMKEYGVVDSWNKLFTFNYWGFSLEAPVLGMTLTGVTSLPTAICVKNSGEILLLLDKVGKGCLYSLDTERKIFEDLEIGGEGYTWYVYSGYYAESLVLWNKASGLLSY